MFISVFLHDLVFLSKQIRQLVHQGQRPRLTHCKYLLDCWMPGAVLVRKCQVQPPAPQCLLLVPAGDDGGRTRGRSLVISKGLEQIGIFALHASDPDLIPNIPYTLEIIPRCGVKSKSSLNMNGCGPSKPPNNQTTRKVPEGNNPQ